MKALDELLKLVVDESKEEATKLVDTVRERLEKSDTDYKTLEKSKNRGSKVKKDLEFITEKLGLDGSDLEGSVEEYLKAKDSSTLDAVKQQLESEISSLKETIQLKDKEMYEFKLNTKFETTALDACRKYKVKGSLQKAFLRDLKDRVVLENDSIVFKNEDGTTVRQDAEDVNLDGYVKSLASSDTHTDWFEQSEQKSGVQGNVGGTETPTMSIHNFAEGF